MTDVLCKRNGLIRMSRMIIGVARFICIFVLTTVVFCAEVICALIVTAEVSSHQYRVSSLARCVKSGMTTSPEPSSIGPISVIRLLLSFGALDCLEKFLFTSGTTLGGVARGGEFDIFRLRGEWWSEPSIT
jgi:hypothetical protein